MLIGRRPAGVQRPLFAALCTFFRGDCSISSGVPLVEEEKGLSHYQGRRKFIMNESAALE